VYPVEKDDTDAILAARRGMELGFREFWFYGSLDGPRLDHTIANLQMLRFLQEQGAMGYLIGKTQIATVVTNSSLLFCGAGGTVSVFCVGGDAAGVTLRGMKYPLDGKTLTDSFPLGVSNQFAGEEAYVSVREGCLLVIWDRKNGIPERGEAL
jgi:thiamine pyrophosphokinase